MYFSSALILLLSALRVATAQNFAACSQLAGYQPAVSYCATRYPAPVPTVTRTTTQTITVKASTTSIRPSTTSSSSKPNTTSAAGNGRTRTITAIAEETVTNCASFTRPACPPSTAKIEAPGGFTSPFNDAGFIRPVAPGPNGPTWGRINGREADPEADPQFGGSFFSGFQAIAWARLLQSGTNNVQSACSCLRPAPSRTSTVSVTATVTATVK